MAARAIRVLHVGKFYSPVEGGIENVVQELVNSFRDDREVRTSVLVAQRKGRGSVDRVDGAEVRRAPSHGVLLGTPLAPRFPTEIARLSREFDIVHVHVPNPLPFFCDWRAMAQRGTRLVIHHHSDIVRPLQRAVLKTIRRQERRFYGAAQRIFVTSRGLLDSSETLRSHRGSCRVLPLSISLDGVRPSSAERRAAVRAELGYGSSDVVFFFLGRLVYYKGVHDLLHAAVGSRGKLLIGGDGPLRAELEELSRRLGIADRVQFLGRVAQSRLPELFSAADAFVLPSNEVSEAFGVVQLEAMAYGLPVINTALPTGVPEVSLHEVSGLTVPPHDPAALRCAIDRMYFEPCLRARFRAAALERVRLYSRENITEKLRTLYREVMDEPIGQVSAGRGRFGLALPGSLAAGSKGDIQPCSTRSLPIFPQRPSLP